jgi:hypothetical protein
VLVALGPHQVEVGHRALVVGVVDDDPAALARAVAQGADALVGPPGQDDVPRVSDADLALLGGLFTPVPPAGTDPAAALATQALAITRGARVVATRDVRGTRRVAHVLAAILSRT